MKKKELKATKAATKSSSATKGTGRGGARPGAGRKKQFEQTQQISFDCPLELAEGIQAAKIENKTTYILALIAADLKARKLPAPHRSKIEAIVETLKH